jgi:hypothetical protein
MNYRFYLKPVVNKTLLLVRREGPLLKKLWTGVDKTNKNIHIMLNPFPLKHPGSVVRTLWFLHTHRFS